MKKKTVKYGFSVYQDLIKIRLGKYYINFGKKLKTTTHDMDYELYKFLKHL